MDLVRPASTSRASMALLLCLIRLAAVAALLPYALDWRSPFLASVRTWALWGFIVVPLAVSLIELWVLRGAPPRLARAGAAASLALALFVLGTTIFFEAQFHWMRHQVLRADLQQLELLGRHVIVGYRDLTELHGLIERRGIGGVFLGARNVHGKTSEEVRQHVAALQDMRRQQELPPLWIATDQEGGPVARLSPPLARSPPLAEIAAAHADASARTAAVTAFASRQGRELAAIGVNLNFAPVVDVNHRVVNPNDQLTRIHERAISADPRVVTAVASDYCAALWQAGVRCTLKHFPGLGRVFEDTHRESADLATSVAELKATDWIPFRALMPKDHFTMVGHVRLTALDAERPASFSRAVVSGLLRSQWRIDGILVTDDFCMAAVTDSGIGGASVA